MKRAGRWLFNFAAAVSLVVCATTPAVMWVRSYSVEDRLFWNGEHRQITLNSFNGHISIYFPPTSGLRAYTRRSVKATWVYTSGLPPQLQYDANRNAKYRVFGFGFNPNTTTTFPPPRPMVQQSGTTVFMPYWFATIAPPCCLALVLWRIRRKRLQNLAGLCPTCGYDLRATPDRCPECGAIPETAKGAAA